MDTYVDVGDMDTTDFMRQDSPCDYPTPAQSSDADQSVSNQDQPKKKRKAWGQPVPEIVPILPPRKRAKTAEEKEQRKNERILRNRRAADKSRQRQKAAQADLEEQNKTLIAENAQLKEVLRQHGLLPGIKLSAVDKSLSSSSIEMDESSPFDIDMTNHTSPPPAYEAEPQKKSTATPVLSAGTPAPSYHQESPALAPTLDLGESAMHPSLTSNLSGMTQYPAVVLCDLQCQPEALDQKLRSLQPTQMVNTVLTFLHCLTILKNFSTSMLSPMSQIFQILAETLATTSTQLESVVLNNFQLIHILISMPMTSTRPAVFRMKLLSRLLASNPSLAPLLMTAADRALQLKLSEENWTEDPDLRWAVASLMTIKWSIKKLEKEHLEIRMKLRNGKLDRDKLTKIEGKGVDCGAVERHYRLFDEADPKPFLYVLSNSVEQLPAPVAVQ